jgi:hypothetical protein
MIEGRVMKRTWLATVFVLVFALVAAACTSDGGDDGNTTGATGDGGQIHLTMWVGYTPRRPRTNHTIPLGRTDGQRVRGGQPTSPSSCST